MLSGRMVPARHAATGANTIVGRAAASACLCRLHDARPVRRAGRRQVLSGELAAARDGDPGRPVADVAPAYCTRTGTRLTFSRPRSSTVVTITTRVPVC